MIESCLRKIDGASSHLLSLISDVLDMSELEYGDIRLEHTHFDLNRELAIICQIVEEQPNEKNVSFSLHTSVTHSRLLGSPIHLRRILLNLLGNAQKYNKQDGHIDFTVTEVSCTDTQAEYCFEIRDTGIGMSPEFVKNELFQPFMQEIDDARTVYRGTGLGMAIVYNLVNRMGGMVTAESTLGVGSTFTVRLTFDRNPGPKPQPSREAAPADISGMRVLVAEDNALNLEIAQTMLEEAGARVTTAVNGALAVECFREANPGTFDAILMDIMMPVMDGLAATRAIRSLPREDAATVPIIAITAKAFTEDREKVFDAGMNEYLTKPIDFAKLHTVLAGYRK